MRVLLDRATYLKGGKVKVAVETEGVGVFDHIDVSVFRVGVSNPSARQGFGKPTSRDAGGVYREAFSTGALPFGFYEIKTLRLQNTIEGDDTPDVEFLPQEQSERALFEIAPPFALSKSKDIVEAEVSALEASIEEEFLAPRYVNCLPGDSSMKFSVFVFVGMLKIGRRYRLDRFELVPAPTGVSDDGEISAVNTFFRQCTPIDLNLPKATDEPTQSQHDNPVSVGHFPTVIAKSSKDAAAYCHSLTDSAILSMGIIRGSSGRVFATVVLNNDSGEATLILSRASYPGNVLTGSMSGESPEVLKNYQERFEFDPIARLWADLYREAQREEHPDFKYFKYWQLLEVMAEDLGEPEGDVYVDEGGSPIADAKNAGSAVKGVFRLLRVVEHASALADWENVNKWWALRNAVGHFGATSQFEKLRRQRDRDWARKALEENAAAGFEIVLGELRRATEHVLRCKVSSND